MNKTLRTMVISDIFILGSFGLIQPIFAVFILKLVPGATVTTVGTAITVQLFIKAIFQIMVAKWGDAERGNCRELYALILGSFLISIIPIGYIFTNSIASLYIVQAVYGFGQALSYPCWRVIFTRYTSPEHTGTEFGIYDTLTSLGIASAATLGAVFVDTFSFFWLFVVVSFLSFVGTGFLIYIFQIEFTCKLALSKRIKHFIKRN